MYKVEDIKFVNIEVPVRYEEEDIPFDYPFRKADMWHITVEHPTGKIINWPKNIPARRLYMKVVDTGLYSILNEDKQIISSIENDYVPDSNSIPGSYGDYLNFEIDEDGIITNWYKEASFYEFEDNNEDEDLD